MNIKKISMIVMLASLSGLLLFSGCARGPAFCRADFSEKILTRIDCSIKDLKLSEEQQAKWGEMRKKAKAGIDRYFDEKKMVSAEIGAELNSKNPDMNKIADIMKKNPPIREEEYAKTIDGMMEFYAMLNDEQKIKVLEKVREFHERFRCSER